MNKEECMKILAYLTAAYPTYYQKASESVYTRQSAVWCDIFGEYPAAKVYAAVRAFISADASGFPPSCGQVVEQIYRLDNPRDTTGAEAWALVRKAVRSSGYDSRAAFETLPPMIQRCVGSPDTLRAMALMDVDKLEAVEQSHFLRTFEAVKRRDAIEARYPQDIRKGLPVKEQPKIETKVEPIPDRRETTAAPADMIAKLRERLK